MKYIMNSIALVVMMITSFKVGASAPCHSASDYSPSVWGVELPVADVHRAAAFYEKTMGFTPVEVKAASIDGPVLDNDGLKIVFRETIAPLPPHGPRLNINLSVPNLCTSIEIARQAGATILDDEPLTAAIGTFIRILDPDGNHVHLIDLDSDDPSPGDAPKLYNVGFTVTDMAAAEAFYTTLGFEIYSRDYLPDTLPLVPVGAAMIVLHPAEGTVLSDDARVSTLLLDTSNDFTSINDDLKGRGIASVLKPRGFDLRDPAGHRIRIIRHSPTMSSASIDGAKAAELFHRFKSLEGEWMARSTVGWEDKQIYSVLANGSVVMQISEFKDDPEATMATMYHLDGARLMLTHYCAAKNQPRMVASSIDDDGTVRFTFLDGTNLASRNVGHMDSALIRFVDDDHFSEQWTFYKDGEASWMEEVTYERVKEKAN